MYPEILRELSQHRDQSPSSASELIPLPSRILEEQFPRKKKVSRGLNLSYKRSMWIRCPPGIPNKK